MSDLDYQQLGRELDRTKSHVFMGSNAAFLGSLMCSMEFVWDETIPTAATDGVKVYWNPYFFLQLTADSRKTVLMHELWHPAKLHLIRRDDRDPREWNIACDIRINNDMEDDGYDSSQLKQMGCWWVDHSFSKDMSAEQIYEARQAQGNPPPSGGGWNPGGAGAEQGDMREPTQAQKQQVVNAVVQAVTAAKMAGQPGSIPGEVEQVLNKFLAPVIPWEQKLMKFFTDQFGSTDYSWSCRDRRFQDIYLPGEEPDSNRLEELNYYFDVSGSVTDAQEIRFSSEVKYIKDTFNPRVLRIIQFDTIIQKVQVITEDEPFEEIVILGRGGTDLTPVREHILETKPTAAIVFSDLFCAPMEKLTHPIPIIWVAIDNPRAKVPFGDQLIYIKA